MTQCCYLISCCTLGEASRETALQDRNLHVRQRLPLDCNCDDRGLAEISEMTSQNCSNRSSTSSSSLGDPLRDRYEDFVEEEYPLRDAVLHLVACLTNAFPGEDVDQFGSAADYFGPSASEVLAELSGEFEEDEVRAMLTALEEDGFIREMYWAPSGAFLKEPQWSFRY